MIKRLVIIGLGLIGGSLALAARNRGLSAEVVACGRSVDKIKPAVELGIVDRVAESWQEAVTGADMVVLAAPVNVLEENMRTIAPWLGAQTILTDVGSTKGSIVEAAERVFGAVPPGFVPGHPIAGTEYSGFQHALEDLFVDHKVILTPHQQTDPAALARVERLWTAVGAEVVEMDPQEHDRVLAATSHAPHMLSYALVKMLADRQDHQAIFDFAAGGFRDFTRIASSDPVMWRAISMANHGEITRLLVEYQALLGEMIERLDQQDGDYMEQLFRQAREARETHLLKTGKAE